MRCVQRRRVVVLLAASALTRAGIALAQSVSPTVRVGYLFALLFLTADRVIQ